MSDVKIINRGRGPELERIRITVFDVLPFFEEGWHHSSIALWYGISSDEVQALQRYYEEHKEEVLAEWTKILQRIAKGNPPEVEAKRAESTAKLQALREKLKQRKAEENHHEGNCWLSAQCY